jgi:Flp pilus assembly pilin Flp
MRTVATAFWNEEIGQDVIEYTLLVAFVTFLAAIVMSLGAGGMARGIWTSGNSTLAAASTSAS